MIVLGIDPGYALMGWGVVESRGSAMRLLDYGVVETKAGTPVQDRLRTLQQGIRRLVQQYHPDDVAFEELFFARNVTTALTVGAARGADVFVKRLDLGSRNRATIRLAAAKNALDAARRLALGLPIPGATSAETIPE